MTKKNNFFSFLAPILGAGAIGVCPLCWIGSASLLTYLGIGVLIPLWKWLVFVLLGLGLIGFILDLRYHKNYIPIILLVLGSYLLYVGRYVFGAWEIWGAAAILILVAIIMNKQLFHKNKRPNQTDSMKIK